MPSFLPFPYFVFVNSMVSQYAIQFRTLAPELAWNIVAMVATFWEGLTGHIMDKLAGWDLSSSLDEPTTLATPNEINFAERKHESKRAHRTPRLAVTFQRSLLPPFPWKEPTQEERFRISIEECAQRCRNNLCLYCGGKEYFLRDYPVRPGDSNA